MPLEVTCRCGMFMRVRDQLAGRTVNCPQCQEPLTIPEPEPMELVEFVPEPENTAYFHLDPPESSPVQSAVQVELETETCPMCGTEVGISARQCPDCGEPMLSRSPQAPPPPVELDRKVVVQFCGQIRAIGIFWVFLGFLSLGMSLTAFSTLAQKMERIIPLVPLLLGTVLVLSWGLLISGVITLSREIAGLYAGLVQSYIFVGILIGPILMMIEEYGINPLLPPIVIALVALGFIMVQCHLALRMGRRLQRQGVKFKNLRE